MIQAATEGGTDVMEFVQRFYVGGVPYDEATRFTEEDVPTLISVLNDPEMKPYWANAATVLGIIGGDRAAEALIAFAEDFEGEAVDPETYRAALDAVLSLGYLVNRDGNREAVAYLSEKARAITEPTRRDATAAEGGEPGLVLSAPTMASSAILGLSLAGTPDTRAVLESLAADAASAEESQPAMPSNSEVGALIADALETHETVAQEGLRALYEKQQ
jgi:hypothetical protein